VEIDADVALDPLSEVTVFRVLQECLGNVEKHAKAGNVEVLLRRGEDGYWLSIGDDGCGFDAAAAMGANGDGVGLIGMRERAELVGGTLAVESRPGGGSRVKLTIPAKREESLAKEEQLGTHPSIAR